MTTLKKGSKGNEVKRLQRLLHLTETGIFDKTLEDAVKAYQKERNLVVDGIVGRKTWEKLLEEEINIKPAYINTHISPLKNRAVKYIAVHYTGGTTSKKGAALSTKKVFLEPKRRASADFIVDDEEIIRVNPDLNNCYCWGVGDKKNIYSGGGRYYGIATNKNTVSIEICSNLKKGFSPTIPNHEGWYFTEAALANATKLIRYLLEKFDLPKYAVIRHYDVSGKICPGIVGWNNATVYSNDGKKALRKNNSDLWNRFWAEI